MEFSMKMARIVMISYVLLTAAIRVGNTDETPAIPAVTRAADCCNPPCPPLCPPSPTN
jgi:hypothetical protein